MQDKANTLTALVNTHVDNQNDVNQKSKHEPNHSSYPPKKSSLFPAVDPTSIPPAPRSKNPYHQDVSPRPDASFCPDLDTARPLPTQS